MIKLLPIGGLVLLAACGQPAPAPAPTNTATPATELGYIARVRALSPGQRAGVLFRAIEAGGGKACQGVTKVDPRPDSATGQPTWLVTCGEGSQWTVVLSDDGTAQVSGASSASR